MTNPCKSHNHQTTPRLAVILPQASDRISPLLLVRCCSACIAGQAGRGAMVVTLVLPKFKVWNFICRHYANISVNTHAFSPLWSWWHGISGQTHLKDDWVVKEITVGHERVLKIIHTATLKSTKVMGSVENLSRPQHVYYFCSRKQNSHHIT